jgi:hypothetical protein
MGASAHSMSRKAMPAQSATKAVPMIDQIAIAIAKADGADIRADPARYRRLAQAALTSLIGVQVLGSPITQVVFPQADEDDLRQAPRVSGRRHPDGRCQTNVRPASGSGRKA